MSARRSGEKHIAPGGIICDNMDVPAGTKEANRKGNDRMSEQNRKSQGLPARCLKLFLSTLYLSAFTFGGGYVIVTLLKKKFVDELKWIDDEEMMDLVAIAQSSPGAIAVNGAIVVGYKIAGVPGIIVSVLGAVLPPLIILTVISFFYQAFRESFVVQGLLAGMTVGVSAVILSVVYDMLTGVLKKKDALLTAVLALAFILNYFLGVNVIGIILGTAALGAYCTLRRAKSEKRKEADQ